MEEKFFVKRQKKGLNVARRHERRNNQRDSRCRSGSEMCRLADLARSFVLSFFVRVGDNLRNKYNKKQSQAECKQPCKLPARFWLANHFELLDYPKLVFDANNFPW